MNTRLPRFTFSAGWAAAL